MQAHIIPMFFSKCRMLIMYYYRIDCDHSLEAFAVLRRNDRVADGRGEPSEPRGHVQPEYLQRHQAVLLDLHLEVTEFEQRFVGRPRAPVRHADDQQRRVVLARETGIGRDHGHVVDAAVQRAPGGDHAGRGVHVEVLRARPEQAVPDVRVTVVGPVRVLGHDPGDHGAGGPGLGQRGLVHGHGQLALEPLEADLVRGQLAHPVMVPELRRVVVDVQQPDRHVDRGRRAAGLALAGQPQVERFPGLAVQVAGHQQTPGVGHGERGIAVAPLGQRVRDRTLFRHDAPDLVALVRALGHPELVRSAKRPENVQVKH